MSIIPLSKVEKIQFCESHQSVWSANAAAIGLTAAQTTAFKNATTAARAAYDAAQAAKAAYRGAVIAQNAAISAMISGQNGAADLIRFIKAFAESSADPAAVYALAQIPLPAPPTPATAPGLPNMIVVTLEPGGAVTLAWDCENAAAGTGGWFNITRKLPGQAAFTLVGGAPGTTSQSRRVSFTDYTVPTSAAGSGAQYIIQGRRGALMGPPSEAITVQFGVEGGGGGGAVFSVNGVTRPVGLAA